MDKLKRVLSGNDETTNDENRGIMNDVCNYSLNQIDLLDFSLIE